MTARIAKAGIPAKPEKRKLKGRVNAAHKDFIRSLPCLVCGAPPRSECAHVRSSGDGGTGLKPHDKFSVPACAKDHRRQHEIGELAFWGEAGIDPLDVALRLWTVSGDIAKGEAVVFKARQRMELNR
jgi:hypothetical protein